MDTRPFELSTQPGSVPNSTVIAASGPLVIEHLFRFQDAWRKNESDFLIFNLGEVVYMDSAAIGSLVNAHVHSLNKGRKMGLAGVSDRVKQILTVTKVDKLFQFYADVTAAEAALSGATTKTVNAG